MVWRDIQNRKLLQDEIRAQERRNVVQARRFSEMLERPSPGTRTARWRRPRSSSNSSRWRRRSGRPRGGGALGLTEDELAFYDALADHEGGRDVMADDVLGVIAHDLAEAIRNSVTIDWTEKEAVRAKMRARVKRLLRRHGYPPDKREAAITTVIEQAEHIARDWTRAA